MSNALQINRDFSNDEISLIRKSVAPTASPQEFELFIYRCKHMGLDPLKPGQIHFVKYGQGAGTIIVGIEGFRSRAAKTGKHSGTKRGVLRNETGKCIGAWCEIYRSDWTHPAREEVSLHEYDTGKAQWVKMPETMIKKVAECAALRMAFPDELGGVYERAEMDQAVDGVRNVTPSENVEAEQDPEPLFGVDDFDQPHPDLKKEPAGAFKITFGKYQGSTIQEVIDEEGDRGLKDYLAWLENAARKKNQDISSNARFLKVAFERFQRDQMGPQ